MSKSNVTLAAAAVLAAVSMAAAGSASAQEYRLTVDRSSLETSEGTAAAYSDLRRQADSICQDANSDKRSLRANASCEQTLVNEAVKRIDNQRLSTLHNGSTIPARYSER